jgi:hypothetical protein
MEGVALAIELSRTSVIIDTDSFVAASMLLAMKQDRSPLAVLINNETKRLLDRVMRVVAWTPYSTHNLLAQVRVG